MAFMLSCGSCATKPPPQPPQQAQLAKAVLPPERSVSQQPAYLPSIARAILKNRMASHAQNMSDLVSAIMVLDYLRIQEGALTIASDASLARPLTDDATELASALPETFFVLQDQLRVEARALSVAAGTKDAFKVADAYGRLSETCVKCHGVYRKGP